MNEVAAVVAGDALDDDGLMRVVRGMAAVDRAVRSSEHAVSPFAMPQALPPASVAVELGWRLCARCGRPVKPSWAVARRGEVFHPVCIMVQLGERVASSASAGSLLPSRGAAGSRSAASEPPADTSKAA